MCPHAPIFGTRDELRTASDDDDTFDSNNADGLIVRDRVGICCPGSSASVSAEWPTLMSESCCWRDS